KGKELDNQLVFAQVRNSGKALLSCKLRQFVTAAGLQLFFPHALPLRGPAAAQVMRLGILEWKTLREILFGAVIRQEAAARRVPDEAGASYANSCVFWRSVRASIKKANVPVGSVCRLVIARKLLRGRTRFISW